MRIYEAVLESKTGMLHHADNVAWADAMAKWLSCAAPGDRGKAGDDRTPAFRWLGNLYHDGKVVAVPTDNLRKMAMEGGAMVSTGKGSKTFKAQTQSGMFFEGTHWTLLANGRPINVAPLLALQGETDFEKHQAAAVAAGFSLLVKRVAIERKKHVRVRPLFESWSLRGRIHVFDDAITTQVLQRVIEHAGLYKGLGDWRPGAKTPGPYGMFAATVTAAK